MIEIKLNSGYSGGLCTAGSYEYVSFFAFFGGVWNALGTAQVNVHDLQSVTPGNPVNYAVLRLSDVTSELCQTLTAVPLRAILSWQAVPTGPDYVPVWGNVLNTEIQPQIGDGIQGEHVRLLRIGDVGVEFIQKSVDPSKSQLLGDYLVSANGTALDNLPGDCNNAFHDSPFGGAIPIEADFTPKPTGVFDPVNGTVLPGAHPIIYQAFITPPSGPQFQLLNTFPIGVFPSNAPIFNPEVTITQTPAATPYGPVSGGAPGALYYTYYESADGQLVDPRVVANFEAGGLPEGNYTVEIDGFAWDGAIYQPIPSQTQTFYVYNGYPPGGFVPLAAPPNLTSVADCGNITVGAEITGSYSVTDEFFGIVTVAMTQVFLGGTPLAMPTVYLSGANNGPDSVVYDGTNTTGTSGTFTIYTGTYDPNKDPTNNHLPNQAPLPPCGYTIQLIAWDRALVTPNCDGHESQSAVGFCLVAAQPVWLIREDSRNRHPTCPEA